jgi:hypothetical protein
MWQRLKLVRNGTDEMRMPVAMASGPPATDRINQAAAISGLQKYPERRDDFDWRQGSLVLGIRHPQMLLPQLLEQSR